MRRIAFIGLLIFALNIAGVPAGAAGRDGDPCATAGKPAPRAAWRIDVDHETAIFMAKHAQRACVKLETLAAIEDAAHDVTSRRGIDDIKGRLRREVLAPIYARYPDLQGHDLTPYDHPAAKTPFHPKHVGRATAYRLNWVFSLIDKRFEMVFAKTQDLTGDRAKRFVEAGFDAMAESGFVLNPVHVAFPSLLAERSARAEKRTTIDADKWRHIVATRGSVHLTATALTFIRKWRAQLPRDSILSLSWSEFRLKKDEDAEAVTKIPPGLSLGAYDRRQVPPDVIEIRDGIPIVFVPDKPERFQGKTVDYVHGKFVLQTP